MNLLNPRIDYTSPQYHMIYDDEFIAVTISKILDSVEMWTYLCNEKLEL